jgi:hypothetical protein
MGWRIKVALLQRRRHYHLLLLRPSGTHGVLLIYLRVFDSW